MNTAISTNQNIISQKIFNIKQVCAELLTESNIKILGTSIAGGILEFYVFVLFGFFAPTFGKLFFPTDKPLVSTLFGFGVFAVGFLMRPLGGIIFGYIGDRFGRRTSLYSSLILMGTATLLIGVMPTYETIGIAAPLFIIFARLLQGLSAGGELPGGLIFAIEHADPRYTGFVGASVEASYGAGTVLGALAGFICSLPGMPEWSWRIFFIIGFVLSLVGLFIRRYTAETPEFNSIQGETEKAPLLTGFKSSPKLFVLVITISSFAGITLFLHDVFLPYFLNQLSFMTESYARFCGTLSCWCSVILMPIVGLYSDKTFRLKPMKMGAILLIISMILMFTCAPSLGRFSVLLIQVSIGISLALFFSPLETFIAELFNKKIRCSCFSFCQNIGIGIFGGATPMVATLIVSKNHGSLLLTACIACWGILALKAMRQLQSKNQSG